MSLTYLRYIYLFSFFFLLFSHSFFHFCFNFYILYFTLAKTTLTTDCSNFVAFPFFFLVLFLFVSDSVIFHFSSFISYSMCDDDCIMPHTHTHSLGYLFLFIIFLYSYNICTWFSVHFFFFFFDDGGYFILFLIWK